MVTVTVMQTGVSFVSTNVGSYCHLRIAERQAVASVGQGSVSSAGLINLASVISL